MATNYLILLPPSEGKSLNGDIEKPYRMVQNIKKYNTFISLNQFREIIFDEVKKIISLNTDIAYLEKIFELKGKNLQEAIEINLDSLNQETMPAILRYNGVMFKSLDYKNLSNNLQEIFNTSALFIDGKFGLLKPTDLIPNYKLKLSSKIQGINLVNFWKEHLAPYFNYLFKDKLIINLLPKLHEKVLTTNENTNIISLKFAKLKNNSLVNLSNESKKLKADLIKYILSFENISVSDLKEFKNDQGFKYSSKYSSKNEIIYLQ